MVSSCLWLNLTSKSGFFSNMIWRQIIQIFLAFINTTQQTIWNNKYGVVMLSHSALGLKCLCVIGKQVPLKSKEIKIIGTL